MFFRWLCNELRNTTWISGLFTTLNPRILWNIWKYVLFQVVSTLAARTNLKRGSSAVGAALFYRISVFPSLFYFFKSLLVPTLKRVQSSFIIWEKPVDCTFKEWNGLIILWAVFALFLEIRLKIPVETGWPCMYVLLEAIVFTQNLRYPALFVRENPCSIFVACPIRKSFLFRYIDWSPK